MGQETIKCRGKMVLAAEDCMPEQHRRGFSLVELLAVIAVVALLVSVLLPALGAARRQAQLLQSLNNVRQITTGTMMYVVDYDDRWPVWPVQYINTDSRKRVAFNSWAAFGATTSDYWNGTSSERTAAEAPVNEYIYPDLVLKDPSETTRLELPIFQSPGDISTYQRRFWFTGEPDYDVSCYEDIGTSYHLNVKWWYYENRPGENDVERYDRVMGKSIFRRAMTRKASTFVWLYDQKFDVIAHLGDSIEGDHGGMNRAVGAFMDGHATYVQVTPGEVYTDEYQMTFDVPKGPPDVPQAGD
jgi:prepilin-type N-terminal cleavage/methylation domain-containing protein